MRDIRTLACPIVVAIGVVALGAPASGQPLTKLDPALQGRLGQFLGQSRVVVTAPNAASTAAMTQVIQLTGGTLGRTLPIINGVAATIPNAALGALIASSAVQHIAVDRKVTGTMERTGATIGAVAARQTYGVDGSGVGVAVIDSGITSWHDDLADVTGATQRVSRFVDFVAATATASDPYGHGTHVAGIIAGNGVDSSGARTGIAPGSHLVVLRVLDGSGSGRISDVIAALDYVRAHAGEENIRVVNLSVAATVSESYQTDPLAQAARRLVDQGIVVVAAAGNGGRDSNGNTRWGSITAPGNAPWVLTVGASSHMGTTDPSDDTVAGFSSRGPTALDNAAKPDLVAPGVGIESLSVAGSALYTSRSQYLLAGTLQTSYLPYLSLTGTSQATPVVSGTVALMLQVNPALTPNAVKAILQYTAAAHPEYDVLTQGAGFLNAEGAVALAQYFGSSSLPYPSAASWSRSLVWGNAVSSGGLLVPSANAWPASVTWGGATNGSGSVEWGVICSADCGGASPSWQSWQAQASSGPNAWTTSCGGSGCSAAMVWSASGEDTVVWGTTDGDTVVWGTSCTGPECEGAWNHD